ELLERVDKEPGVLVLRDNGAFNFSRLNNLAARAADGEVLCLLNNDVEPFDDDWLTTLVRYVVQQGVGGVGAQLVYPSGRIQHAVVCVVDGGGRRQRQVRHRRVVGVPGPHGAARSRGDRGGADARWSVYIVPAALCPLSPPSGSLPPALTLNPRVVVVTPHMP